MRPAPLLSLLLLACAHAPLEVPVPRPDETRLLALERELFAALRARDLAALEALLTEDFVLHAPGSPPVGRAAFLEGIRAIPGTLLSVEGEGVRARVYGEVGVLTGLQRARVRLADGTEVLSVSVFTDVALWREGRWRLAQAHSAELPPSAAAAP